DRVVHVEQRSGARRVDRRLQRQREVRRTEIPYVAGKFDSRACCLEVQAIDFQIVTAQIEQRGYAIDDVDVVPDLNRAAGALDAKLMSLRRRVPGHLDRQERQRDVQPLRPVRVTDAGVRDRQAGYEVVEGLPRR